MAEVRLSFGTSVCKLLKPHYVLLLDKDTVACNVAALVNSAETCQACLEASRGIGARRLRSRCKDVFPRYVNARTPHGHVLGLGLTVSAHVHALHGQGSTVIRPYSVQSDVPLYQSRSVYYDLLEVSPTATLAQIKTAYYKQCFIYHPDKNAGSEEAAYRFSQISEAYSVLGNRVLRRKYDRGVLSRADLQETGKHTGPPSSSTARPPSRARHAPSAAHQQKIFDFDTFYKAHYGEQLQREKELRWRREQKLRKTEAGDWSGRVKMGRVMEAAVGMLLAMAALIFLSLKHGK